MTETSIEQPNDTHPAKAAMYHQHKPGKIKAIKVTDLSDRIPGGGVQSTVMDLLKFGDAVLKGILLKPETLALMVEDSGLKKEGNGYGMGWYLYGTTDKYGTVFGHSGGQLGCSSFMLLLPKYGMTVVSLSNTSGEVGVFQVLNRMMQENVKKEEKR
jgi:CubicO group peptidase (beta-lactamase class C family)